MSAGRSYETPHVGCHQAELTTGTSGKESGDQGRRDIREIRDIREGEGGIPAADSLFLLIGHDEDKTKETIVTVGAVTTAVTTAVTIVVTTNHGNRLATPVSWCQHRRT